MIHRDIKPENLLLTRDGSTLVADFGIARALAGADDRLTETGLAIGTPAYMSPEQAAGDKTLDARTDVYSLGAVLYEMLAGEPPFTGPTAQAIIAKRFSGEVPRCDTRGPACRSRWTRRSHGRSRRWRRTGSARRRNSPGAAPAAGPVLRPRPLRTKRDSRGKHRSPGSTTPPDARARRVPMAAITLGLGFLVGLGVLFAWRQHAHVSGEGTGPKRLAVLPFENLGDSADAYFADGITDEVRGKLSQVPGSRSSREPARTNTGKRPRHPSRSPASLGPITCSPPRCGGKRRQAVQAESG